MKIPASGEGPSRSVRDALVSISEASKTLGVSEAALRQWTDEGKIKAFITPGGHRRYSQAELRRFVSSHQKVLGLKDLVAQIEGAAVQHREMRPASPVERLPEPARGELAQLGRQLLHSVSQYVTDAPRREAAIEEARRSGHGFGETLARMGLTLTDSVEAFIMHRDPLINAASLLMKRREALSGRVYDAIPLVIKVMDEALIALVNAYQHQNGLADRKGTKADDIHLSPTV